MNDLTNLDFLKSIWHLGDDFQIDWKIIDIYLFYKNHNFLN
jgi:hypothetical protein